MRKNLFLFAAICAATIFSLPLMKHVGDRRPVESAMDKNNQTIFTKPESEAGARVMESYGRLPLNFEANIGQTDDEVKYLSRGNGYNLFLTPTEAVLQLRKTKKTNLEDPKESQSTQSNYYLRMRLVGANAAPQTAGLDELPGKSNYFIGNDPKRWRTDVPHYSKAQYKEVYSGVDLVYYGNQRQLEYDFIVKPGANPNDITLGFEGTDGIEVDEKGDLVLHASGALIKQHKPIVYQKTTGGREIIEGRYVIKSEKEIGFEVAEYDVSKPLIIDPVLSYSTYLGGSGFDAAAGIAVDASGNAYVTGVTNSINFPTASPFDSTLSGPQDAFVTKLNPEGSALVYSTYLGGGGEDSGNGIVIDALGNAYVAGTTRSSNYPVTAGAFQTSYQGGFSDAFVTKLNPSGNAIQFSTYLGGSGRDFVFGGSSIAADSNGNVFVTGGTDSTNFPTMNPLQPMNNGGGADLFVTKLNPAGDALIYSTYLGGNGFDALNSAKISIDSGGNAYLAGDTNSSNFPTTAGAFDPTYNGSLDVYVTKLNAAGNMLVYSTYLGGSGEDASGGGVVVDSAGNAYVTGNTRSTNFPIVNPIQPSLKGGLDAFVTKLNPTGSALIYSTYLGGSGGNENSIRIAIDSAGNAYVSGLTNSPSDFPLVNPVQAVYGGAGSDGFVAKLNAAGNAILFSTFLGGSGDEGAVLAIDPSGNIYATGGGNSTNFPTTPGSFQTIYGGGSSEAFIVKISDQILLSIDDVQVTEGDTGTVNAVFTVTRTPASGPDVQFTYKTADGTATAGLDYGADSNTITIPAGMSSTTVTIPVFGDLLDETNETFFVNLSNPINAVISDGQGIGTIIDDDPQPSLSIEDASIAEGDSGMKTFSFSVKLSGPSGLPISVEFNTANGTATAGSDYRNTGGTLSFAPGDTMESADISIIGDAIVEADENFFVILSGAMNATIANGQATGVILNDDAIMLSPATLPNGVLCTFYNQTITADNGTSPYIFAITSGALPYGLMLSSDGNLSGTPVKTGDFPFTVTATDANGFAGTRSYSIQIAKANTTTTVASSLNPSNLGDSVTFTAMVSSKSQCSITPTGTVIFTENGADTSGPVPVDSNGKAVFTTSALNGGMLVIKANYSGDDDFNPSSGSVSQKVNRPPTVDAGGPYFVNEGSDVLVTASGNDPDGDALIYKWDLDGDGIFETEGQTVTFSAATLDGPMTRTIRVKAIDPMGLKAEDDATVNVLNVAPSVNAPTLSAVSIFENDSVNLSGSFTDPGVADTHTAIINWGDGSADTALSLAAGILNFTATHKYLDDNPTGTPSDVYNITVVVMDDDGGENGNGTSITVNNVAPVITEVTGPGPIALGAVANVTVKFADPGSQDSFSITYAWDDGQTDTMTGVTDNSFSASHTYASPGVYTVAITVTDDDTGSAGFNYQFVVVYDPNGGFVTGGGFINSPPGAYAADPTLTGKANFGFVSKYQKGATVPTGNTEFQFKAGNFNFKSTEYEFLVISGPKAQFKGTGTVNGSGVYGFLLIAADGQSPGGGGVDKFRIKIWDKNKGDVVYDNVKGSSDDIDNADPQAIAGGSIVIHK